MPKESEKTIAFDALIFDLDGTLWDSSASCARGWNEALTSLGIENKVSRDAIGGIMGLPHEEIAQKMFPEVPREKGQAILDACYHREIEKIQEEGSPLYPGVMKGLPTLATRYRLFIVSNCQTDYMATFMGVSGLSRLFVDTECHGATGLSKGENLKLIVKRNGIREPVYIGDTSGDQSAAARAGIPYYHVDYGFGAPDRECHRFGSFRELVDYFMKL